MRLQQTFDEVFDAVREEREHQERKWGPQYHNIHVWNSITGEEYGEMVKAINEAAFFDGNTPELVEAEQHRAYWQEVMDEAIDTITCTIQLYEEARRRRDFDTTGVYSAVNTPKQE